MPFEEAFKDVYKLGIKAACVDAETYCERLDEQIFDESMLERVYNQIAKADLIIADMTGRNPNVFYEVGYAHALGKRVILVTKKADDIPFDLKHYYHIVYGGSISRLKDDLTPRIQWFASHPIGSEYEALDGVQFFIDGKPLTNDSTFHVKTTYRHHEGEYLLPINVAIHNPAQRRVSRVLFTPILISPSAYDKCIIYEGGSTIHFQSIQLPDNKYAHRPLNGCSIEPGGWDSVVFNLHLAYSQLTSTGPNYGAQLELLLRILTDGPAHDIPFKAIVEQR